MNPFHTLRDYLVSMFPWAYDLIYVLGKTSRGFFFLLVVVLVLSAREAWMRMWRKDLKGEGFAMHQAFAFAALAYGLQAPYALIPEISWRLALAVSTTVLIFMASLAVIRVFCYRTHKQMVGGDVHAALRLGLYVLGAGFASHAVVSAAFGAG